MKFIYQSVIIISILIFSQLNAQILTKEDSLSAGLIVSKSATVLSSYGNVKYSNNITNGTSSTNVDRLILFIGHKFKSNLSFFSELEVEDAKIEGGSSGGEFAIEQAFIKFDINRNNYISAGLIIPRIGIINENHLPNTFNGNDRPYVEKYIIPATWREVGIGYYGYSNKIAGLNYSLAALNGLNSEGFTSEEGIREGRYEGSDANANTLALTGSLLYYRHNLRTQFSVYFGGSNTLSKGFSDSVGLSKGVFGAPVQLYEYDIQYKWRGLLFKGLVSFINISDADKINAGYNNNIAENMLGFYGELGYNITHKKQKAFILFTRYENIDMTKKINVNSDYNPAINLQYLVSGITYMPHPGVSLKLDYTHKMTGSLNGNLVDPSNPYKRTNESINLGIGYSF